MSTGETTEGNTAQARRLQLPVPSKIEILKHAPGEILVVNKPVDIRMNGDHDVTVESLIHKTLDNEKYKKLKWIHRLDMATSGVLVIGLSKKISAVFHDLFDGRLSQKCYVALLRGHLKRKEACVVECPKFAEKVSTKRKRSLVEGEHEFLSNTYWIKEEDGEAMCVDVNIAKHPEDSFKMAPGSLEGMPPNRGRVARTKIRIQRYEMYEGNPVTRVPMYPLTGRRHQLRVHALYIGHPILGDFTYDRAFSVKHDVPRMMLHAKSLTLPVAKSRFFKNSTKASSSFKSDKVLEYEAPCTF